MTNGLDIRENFILKLFDTIKESNNSVKDTMSKQTDAINSLVKEGVKNEDLKIIMVGCDTKLTKLFSRVNLMIACVSIAFAISAVSYFFIRSSVDNMIHNKIEEHNIFLKDDKSGRDSKYDELNKKINEILKNISPYL